MTLDAVIRHLTNRAAAARHMAAAHHLDGNTTASNASAQAADWFTQQATDLASTNR